MDVNEYREKLHDTFKKLFDSDTDAPKAIAALVEAYQHSLPEVQGILNYVTIAFCGYSIPTLLRAMDQEEFEPEPDAPVVFPEMVSACTALTTEQWLAKQRAA